MEIVEIKKDYQLKESNPGLKEYQLVIFPGNSVLEKIQEERHLLLEKYETEIHHALPPHITVSSFLAREEMEETLIRWIQRIYSSQKAFLVTLNNYSGFPPCTIYLRILDLDPFQQLAFKLKAIDDFIAPGSSHANKPHLSFVSRLPERIFEKALFHYAQKKFHESFVVKELILQKKDPVNPVSKSLYVFPFLPINKCML